MNPYLDQQSCNMCKMCYRQDSSYCRDACKRCSTAMFSEDSVNIYPQYGYSYPYYSSNRKSQGTLYYNFPKVTNYMYPSMFPYANYYGSIHRPILQYW